MRHPRHRRRLDARRDTVRRMLVAGALVGLVGGIGAQALVSGVDAELRPLVRVALLMPAAVFVAWWLLMPGLTLERDDAAEPAADAQPVDADERLQRIEAAFGADGVPASQSRPAAPADAGAVSMLQGSIRRPAASGDTAGYGVRRPEPPAERAARD